jgi:endoribonuclease L-PSP
VLCTSQVNSPRAPMGRRSRINLSRFRPVRRSPTSSRSLRERVSAAIASQKLTAYLVGVEYWPAFNAIYAEVLGNHRPARAVVPVPALHHGYLIELEAIAVR